MRGELQEPVLARIAYRPDKMADMDLSRICAAPSARLGHLAFESQGAFASQC
jgi:hypothetical protein